MEELAGRITDAELAVMRVIWRAEGPLPLTEIRKAVSRQCGWEATTIKTLVARLVKKGVLRQQRREVYYYAAAVSERAYNAYATEAFLDKVYAGSAGSLVASLVTEQRLSQADVAGLRALLEGGQ